MATVIIEQFNPKTSCWNKIDEVAFADFDPKAQIGIDKYGGPYRTRTVGQPVKVKPRGGGAYKYSPKYFTPKKRA